MPARRPEGTRRSPGAEPPGSRTSVSARAGIRLGSAQGTETGGLGDTRTGPSGPSEKAPRKSLQRNQLLARIAAVQQFEPETNLCSCGDGHPPGGLPSPATGDRRHATGGAPNAHQQSAE
ncbi:hypothetical protein NN561_015838 [Cricetulus griseus]